jgi:hypothetical protein
MEDLFGAAQARAQSQMMNNMQQSQGMMPMQDQYGQGMMQGYNQHMQGYGQGMMPMQDPYNQNMMMQQNMYGTQMINPYGGRVDQMGYVHYSRGQVLQMLRDYVIMNTGKTIVCEEKLDDLPMGSLRHCCAESKSIITSLSPYTFQLPEAGIQFQFYFCMDCCKLFYPKDFMI